jgi:D-alanyl-D-alanine carboxypeptidase
MPHLRTTVLAALVALTGLVATGVPDAPPAAAHTRDTALQRSLNDLVRDGAVPGALASVRDRHGRVTHYTAGVGDLRTGAKVPVDGYVRIASNTKMFTAVVVLQLVGEGKLKLTDPVEKILPGVVRGDGIDAQQITIRHLLQHTSGLQDNTFLNQGVLNFGNTYFEPRELLDSAFTQKPEFAPGQAWEYSNAGYVLLGLVAQRVTGRPFAEEVTNRIIDRIGLRHTYYPGVGDRTVRRPHPRGYLPVDGKLVDITEFDPSIAGAAGQIIATPSDLNRFLVALQNGRLLKPQQLAEMRTSVPATGLLEGWRYGLGTIEFPLSCGGTAWGHGGDSDGYQTRAAITADGRAVTIAATNDDDETGKIMEVLEVFDAALCANR